ncbi:Uncharacterized protein HSRCO_1127 [Halanaeroarchaeum sp. HSR-CO]|uniref:DUF7331 family protein n=1 Tax=Halanaeroarchaeum sp. HSR-CO TaxID=2866382 RepID=UPI00217DA277|nr:hypothetical protein [Halanaeroarchaeum sp. HSR-CO]UWG47415.1 Uncharacterized protein HSRCO_1127 [Halanaeroarchaeum sp. HSR-CO]
MSDSATGGERPSDVPQLPEPNDPVDRVEGYRTEDGVVLYDSRNPLAWIKSTVSTSVGEMN